jgi:hypothetical protein|tara:strand:+ start:2383 stop:3570 length:1188 start_codon:yes stop_codon:yes gene_type:complete
MKKNLLILFFSLLLIGCSSVKKTQKAINKGNYDKAISIAIRNLKNNKTKKENQPYVLLLEEAFAKASKRDQGKITFLKQDANPENLESIYNLYLGLNKRQHQIKPLLPLRILKNNANARFNMVNYAAEIINAKKELSNYLYSKVKTLFASNYKYDYRKAYEELKYIEEINPNYKDTPALIQEANAKGIDYVFVSMKNETEQVVPKKLEKDLLNFDTYGLNDFWTVYHSRKDTEIKYDFGLSLNLRKIEVSPEQVREKQIIKEKQIKDGYQYLLDTDGNQVKDSLGNNIKVDKLINVRCELYQFTQFKSAYVSGQVTYVDFHAKQTIKVFPIKSEFIFEHSYADYDGDKRALGRSFLSLLKMKSVVFPTNEQMIYDTGSDLKKKLKAIISRNKFTK